MHAVIRRPIYFTILREQALCFLITLVLLHETLAAVLSRLLRLKFAEHIGVESLLLIPLLINLVDERVDLLQTLSLVLDVTQTKLGRVEELCVVQFDQPAKLLQQILATKMRATLTHQITLGKQKRRARLRAVHLRRVVSVAYRPHIVRPKYAAERGR